MKQQIKCPHCNKFFPLEESLKQETEELRKKLRAEEKEKSKEFFNKILLTENANQEILKEAQKRLNRDLSE